MIFSRFLFGVWAGQFSYLLSELFLLVGVLAYLRYRNKAISELISLGRLDILPWILVLGISSSAIILFAELGVFTQAILPIPTSVKLSLIESYRADGVFELLVLISGVVIAASFVEEIIFRGIIQRTLMARANPAIALLLTSLIFSAVHFQAWWIIQLALFAILAGWLTWRSGSLIPAIVLHIANNLWSLLKYQQESMIVKSLFLDNNHVQPALLISAIVVFGLCLSKFRSYHILKA